MLNYLKKPVRPGIASRCNTGIVCGPAGQWSFFLNLLCGQMCVEPNTNEVGRIMEELRSIFPLE